VSSQKESRVEAERRAWVERHERFKDLQERYERQLPTVSDAEQRRKLAAEFAAARRAQREEDIALVKRLPGTGVATRQIMWARWLEVAVEHEMEARRCFKKLLAELASEPLSREFRASLVAVTASAHAIEAVFGEVKYLIPPQPKRGSRHRQLRRAFRSSFGITDADDAKLADELAWLFPLRDSAAHPYTELLPTGPHPAGTNTGVEHALFNAVTSGRAVDTAMTVIRLAAVPPGPRDRWIERWVTERVTPSFSAVVVRLQEVRASELLERG
jgi:hypothetical protein